MSGGEFDQAVASERASEALKEISQNGWKPSEECKGRRSLIRHRRVEQAMKVGLSDPGGIK